PCGIVTRAPENRANDGRHVDRLRVAAGDPSGYEHRSPVDGNFDAAECTPFPSSRFLDERIRDRVAELVGVPRQNIFGNKYLSAHDPLRTRLHKMKRPMNTDKHSAAQPQKNSPQRDGE